MEMSVKIIPVLSSSLSLSIMAVSMNRIIETERTSSEAEFLIYCKTLVVEFAVSRLAARKFSVSCQRQ